MWFIFFYFFLHSYHTVLHVHSRLAEEYKEQSWAAMSELEKELQQIEAQYGEQFGDASESEEEEQNMDIVEKNSEQGGGQWDSFWLTLILLLDIQSF